MGDVAGIVKKLLGLGLLAGAGWWAWAVLAPPKAPAQPVPFSHAHHVGELGIDCRHCHDQAETTAHAGFPPMHTCMSCHYPVETPPPVEAVRWTRVIRFPDFTYFNHAVHLDAGVGCSTCHGRIDRMEQTLQARDFTMKWCLDCHRDPAPHLRPPGQITVMDWTPPPGQRARGETILAHQGIVPSRLDHCYVCHR